MELTVVDIGDIWGIYLDNGRENGNYYHIGVISGVRCGGVVVWSCLWYFVVFNGRPRPSNSGCNSSGSHSGSNSSSPSISTCHLKIKWIKPFRVYK